ncbi:periphilin-1 isoform X1 [Osmerus eperlanus]|uniref:periphilin-1 isoform X1 n=1 Tax=Osmerus eperlanus TaxID=29151 RepID=UPI002E14F218
MAYRRERNIREVYEERFIQDRAGPYPRGPGAPERRSTLGRPEEEYSRAFEYESPARFYPNGGAPRSYHGEEQRGYHGDSLHFPNERRAVPPARREDPYLYRGPREEPHTTRQMDFRSSSSRAAAPPSVRGQMYPAPRSLSAVVPEGGDDTLMQAILSLDRSEERDPYRRKGQFPPLRERSPQRRDVPPSPHSRSGSSVSSRGYSPDRAKGLAYPPQGKSVDCPQGHGGGADLLWGTLNPPQAGHDYLDKDRPAGLSVSVSRDGSPQSTASTSKEEAHVLDGDRNEGLGALDESHKILEDFKERRAQAIAAKAHEIEKVFRQDCETFSMVVKMLVDKDASLESQLQMPLMENIVELRERCFNDLKHFVSELDQVVLQEPSV